MLVAASSSFKANTTPFNSEQTIFKKTLLIFLINSYIPMVLKKKKIIRLTKSASNDIPAIYRSAGPTVNFPVPQSKQNEPSSAEPEWGLGYIKRAPSATANLWVNNALCFLLWASEVASLITIKISTQNITALWVMQAFGTFPHAPRTRSVPWLCGTQPSERDAEVMPTAALMCHWSQAEWLISKTSMAAKSGLHPACLIRLRQNRCQLPSRLEAFGSCHLMRAGTPGERSVDLQLVSAGRVNVCPLPYKPKQIWKTEGKKKKRAWNSPLHF